MIRPLCVMVGRSSVIVCHGCVFGVAWEGEEGRRGLYRGVVVLVLVLVMELPG